MCMNETINYRPYRTHGWFVPYLASIGILLFIFIGFCIPDRKLIVLILTIIEVFVIVSTKVLYDSSNVSILFERDGLRIVGGKHSNYRYIPWEKVSYAYYIRNYKGHLFLVLSLKELSSKEAKRFVNKGANTSKIYFDSVVVIYIDFLQNVEPIKEFISNHVVHINTC